MENKIEKLVPVYLSFSTFQSVVTSLREHGLPKQIDKSAFSSRSGGEQSQIISAFKFLGFLDENDNTQPSLRKLVDSEKESQEEKAILEEIIRDRYAKVFEHDLNTATPKQIENAIGDYGAKGTTRDRAVRFFIKALEFCEISISARLTQGSRTSRRSPNSNTKNEMLKPSKRKKKKDDDYTAPPSGSSRHAMKTISLPGAAGELSITGNFNLFDLVGEERELVFGIIDRMNEHEKKSKPSP